MEQQTNPEAIQTKQTENLSQKSQDQVQKELQKSPKEQMEEFLSNEENKKQLHFIAEQIQKRFRNNWFELEQVLKKTPYKDRIHALNILNLMKFSDLLVAEIRQGKEKYKITLTNNQRLEILKSRKLELEQDLKQLEEEIKVLENK